MDRRWYYDQVYVLLKGITDVAEHGFIKKGTMFGFFCFLIEFHNHDPPTPFSL